MNQQHADLFTNALTEAQKVTVWQKLSAEQQARLLSRYIMQFFTALNREETGDPADAMPVFSETV